MCLGVLLLAKSGKIKDFYELTNETLKTVGPILFVTAAGGVLGKVISSSNLIDFIKNNAQVLKTMGYLFPFLLAAILKTAQGSSTVAITTSAGIIAPIMQSIGFVTPVSAALVVVAIGAGAMTVSHANDSYFWVVTNFGEMDTSQGYKIRSSSNRHLKCFLNPFFDGIQITLKLNERISFSLSNISFLSMSVLLPENLHAR